MNRVIAIDTLRGLMLVLMMVVHLLLLPFISISNLLPYVYGPLGFFTDAEGFFFLSGLVAGIVYGRMFCEGRAEQASLRIYRRVKQIYFCQMGLLIAVAICLSISNLYFSNWKVVHDLVPVWKGNEGILFFLEHPFHAAALGCFFLYLPPFLDILPMYILFLGITPYILGQLSRERIRLVFGVSLVLWAAAQFIPSRILETTFRTYLPVVKLGWFDLMAWQLLFVAGLALGFLKIQGRLRRPTALFTALSVGIAIFCCWLKYQVPAAQILAKLYVLGPLRLMSFGAIACIAWSFHQRIAIRPLAFLGRYSLQVFVYHTALCYLWVFFLVEITSMPFLWKLGLISLSVLSLWLPAYFTDQLKKRNEIVRNLQ